MHVGRPSCVDTGSFAHVTADRGLPFLALGGALLLGPLLGADTVRPAGPGPTLLLLLPLYVLFYGGASEVPAR